MVNTMNYEEETAIIYKQLFEEFTYNLELFQQRETKVFQFLESCPPPEFEMSAVYIADPKVDTKTCIFIQIVDMTKKSLSHFISELFKLLSLSGFGAGTLSSSSDLNNYLGKEIELVKRLDRLSNIFGSRDIWNIEKRERTSKDIDIHKIAKRYDKYVRLRNHICHTFKAQEDKQRLEIPEVQQIRSDLLDMLRYVIKPFIECHLSDLLKQTKP